MANPVAIPFAEWLPDKSDRFNPTGEAKGVHSLAGQYAPFPDIQTYGANAKAAAVVMGGDTFYDSSTLPQIFFGDSSKLYHLVSRAADNVAKVGGYTVGASDTWQMAQFGNNVVAVTRNEAPQHYVMGTSTDFANLAGSPPTGATSVARVSDFMWMGKLYTVYWSAFNDVPDGVPAPVT